MATPLPILISARAAKVPGGQIWLGGGEPDLKLRVDLDEFVNVFNTLENFSAKLIEVCL